MKIYHEKQFREVWLPVQKQGIQSHAQILAEMLEVCVEHDVGAVL